MSVASCKTGIDKMSSSFAKRESIGLYEGSLFGFTALWRKD